MFSATSRALSEPLNLSGEIKKRMANNRSHCYHCHPEHKRRVLPKVTDHSKQFAHHRQFAESLTVSVVRGDTFEIELLQGNLRSTRPPLQRRSDLTPQLALQNLPSQLRVSLSFGQLYYLPLEKI